MRIGALLLVGIGILSTGACTVNTSNDEVCVAAGGVCIPSTNLASCGEELSGGLCSTGETCCSGLPDAHAAASSAGSSAGSSSAAAKTGDAG